MSLIDVSQSKLAMFQLDWNWYYFFLVLTIVAWYTETESVHLDAPLQNNPRRRLTICTLFISALYQTDTAYTRYAHNPKYRICYSQNDSGPHSVDTEILPRKTLAYSSLTQPHTEASSTGVSLPSATAGSCPVHAWWCHVQSSANRDAPTFEPRKFSQWEI